ncbi:MAG TPA: hypothetical protein VGL35_08640 [Rhizomicrobium sp.]
MRYLRSYYIPAVLFASAAPAAAAVTISTAATQNVSCAAGVCTPTAANVVLNANDLETMLASGNAEVTTTGTGVQANDIRIAARVSWSGTSTLSLDAFKSVAVERPVTVEGTGGVSVRTNDGGNGGDFACENAGRLTFKSGSSALTINGTSYRLLSNIATLASAIDANPSGAFALAGSYDASRDGTYATPPVPTVFTGSFEGLGNAISNLTINDPTDDSFVGLFAEIAGTATLANMRLLNESVTGGSGTSSQSLTESIGGVVGNGAGGSIAHVFVSGTASGGSYAPIGGLTGAMTGTITASSAAMAIKGGNLGAAGGLVGIGLSTVRDSVATGDVSGSGFVGGLVGAESGEIEHSFATGKVTATDDSTSAGGLAGISEFEIHGSHATGAVSCILNCGGLVGFLGGGPEPVAKINQSWAAGSVTSSGGGGGLVGYNELGAISDTYATGAVSAQVSGGLAGQNDNSGSGDHAIQRSYSSGAVNGSDGFSGGLIGADQFTSTMKRSYWDMTTSGITDPGQGAGNIANDPGIKGLSNAKLQSRLPDGFSSRIWTENPSINSGLPYLIANPPPR